MRISTFMLGLALPALAPAAMAQTNSASLVSKGVTVGTSSVLVSNAKTARRHLELVNQSQTVIIYCTIDGTAAVASTVAGQLTVFPGGGQSFSSGVIPNNEINCIAASASTPLTVIE